jgi:hypothetical protein
VTGSAPTVAASVDQPKYRRGGQVRARVDITDPDNRVEPMVSDGTDPGDGTAVHIVEQRYHSDIPHVLWRYQGSTAPLGTGLTLTLLAPARSVVLEAVVTDAQGHTVVTSVPVTVQGLRVGVDVQGAKSTLADLDAAWASWPAFTGPTKLFWPAGAGLPTWDGKTAHVPASAVPHLCFVDIPNQAQWLAFLDGVPAGLPEVWLTWLQEGDRKTTAAAFKSTWEQLWAWAEGHPNRDRVRLVPVLTWYWQRYKNADRYADWIPTHLDMLGVDIYPGGQSGWTSPAECLRAPLAAARTAKVKLVVTEAGVVVKAQPSAADLQARADWHAGLLSTADAAGDVDAIAVWQADGDQAVGTGGFIAGPTDPMRAVLAPYLAA